MSPRIRARAVVVSAVAAAAAMTLAGCSTGTASTQSTPASNKTLQIAYLSFAVANSYDAPMLAAAQAAAADGNAKLTVFDANNDPQKQFTQLQNAIASGKYDGIITQPILSTGLTSLVEQAIGKGIKVVNIDQILGPSYSTDEPQVKGLSANVTFVPTDIGKGLGEQTVAACAAQSLDPCDVGYLYDIKASTLDVAIRQSFDKAVSGSPVKVVAEGEDFFTPASGVTAVQNMLQAHPEIKIISGSDQGLEGALTVLASTKKQVGLVGFGASGAGINGLKAGTIFSETAQAPASEGRLGVQALIKAIRTGKSSGAIDPVAQLPGKGLVTKENADQFTAEWPG